MLTMMKHTFGTLFFLFAFAIGSLAQTDGAGMMHRMPSSATRQYVVLQKQSLADLEKKLRPDNKVEELFGGTGVELRVAVQHEKNKPAGDAEVHDASDDVYYVLEGSAMLTLGGKLDTPREAQPGEWRAPQIVEGKTIEIKKGDLIVVPRGTPHQRSTAGKDFSMILIKIYTGGLPAPQK